MIPETPGILNWAANRILTEIAPHLPAGQHVEQQEQDRRDPVARKQDEGIPRKAPPVPVEMPGHPRRKAGWLGTGSRFHGLGRKRWMNLHSAPVGWGRWDT